MPEFLGSFLGLFQKRAVTEQVCQTRSYIYRRAFSYLDVQILGLWGDGVHVFLPFFGGPDDRLALDFVVQICANPRVSGTVVRITKCDGVAVSTGEAQAGALTSGIADKGLDPEVIEELNRLTVGSVNLFYSFNCENKY